MCGCSGGGGRNAFWRTFLIGDGGGDFRGRFGAGGMWYLRLGWRFCDGGGGSRAGGFRIGGESYFEAGLGLFDGKDIFLVVVESNVGRRKNAQCRWVSLCYSDVGRIFEIVFLFQWIVT